MTKITAVPDWEYLPKTSASSSTAPIEEDHGPSIWDRIRSAFLGDEKKTDPQPYVPGPVEKLFCSNFGIRRACSEDYLREEGHALVSGASKLFEGLHDLSEKVRDAWRLQLGSWNYWYEHTKATITGKPSPFVRPSSPAPAPVSAKGL